MKPPVHPRLVWYGVLTLVVTGLIVHGTPLATLAIVGLYAVVKTVLLERMGVLGG